MFNTNNDMEFQQPVCPKGFWEEMIPGNKGIQWSSKKEKQLCIIRQVNVVQLKMMPDKIH